MASIKKCTKMKNLYFFQFNFEYGKEVYIPYSVGAIWAYAKTIKEIESNYANKGFIFIRQDPNKIVSSLDNPDVAAFSTYLWNWEISVEVAKIIKNKFPGCLVIFGGHHVPNDTNGFFDKYPFIDILVHGEGEITFSDILKERLRKNNYSNIGGITTKKFKTIRKPAANLNNFPSPYLAGIFDEILKLPYNFQPIWETNRGCPYSCLYCDWGSASCQKIRIFSDERIQKEIEWFAEKKISFLFSSDSNFGILPRDINIAKKLSETKFKTGYPKKFRTSFAKNSNEAVLKIAKILNEQELDKGITLSVQSMDKNTLKIINRLNLGINSLSSLVKKYQEEGIPTFNEIILGLPGETYESFKEGVSRLLDAGFHDSLVMYLCILLPNAKMNNPAIKNKYKIKSVRAPIFLGHSVPGLDPVQEYEEIIIGTKCLSVDDWKKQYIFSWIIQLCHILNLTQVIAIYFKVIKGLNYSDFYEKLLIFAEKNPKTILGKELSFVKDKVNHLVAGGDRDTVLKEFSNITWPPEEVSYLRISKNMNKFFNELKQFVKELSGEIIEDLISYQQAIIVKWKNGRNKELKLNYPIHDFYKAQLIGKDFNLAVGKYKIKIIDDLKLNGDKKRYAKEILWWGRKGGRFIYQNIKNV